MAKTEDSKSIADADQASIAAANTISTGDESEALNVFAQNLLVEKGAYKLDADTVAAMKKEILDRLDILVNKVSLSALSDEQLKEFNTLLDKQATTEELQKYISDRVPDLQDRLTEALYRFRLVYLGIQ